MSTKKIQDKDLTLFSSGVLELLVQGCRVLKAIFGMQVY